MAQPATPSSDANVITLRIHIQKTDAYKVMRFETNKSVGEVLKEVRAKLDDNTGGKDHGLFIPPNKETGRKGKWLDKTKNLRFYGLANNNTIEFKKKHRTLRIRLVDDTKKMVLIDDSANVREISDVIGEKINLKSSEEFSLRKPGGLSKAPLWLNEQQTLHEQDIGEDEELEYAKKFYFSDDFIDKDDPFTLHLLYVEANKAIIEGKYPISIDNAKDFAALQLQIVYGDHDPNKHKPGFFDVNVFLPKTYRKDKNLVRDILHDHRKLVGMNDMNAKFRYVQLVRSLKTYGITFFECEQRIKGKKKPISVLIGITREKIIKVEPETQRVVKEWTWNHMRRWSSVKNTFTLDFGDYEDDYLNLYTEEAEAMSQLISGYIDIILKSRVDPQRVIEDSDDEIADEEQMEAKFGLGHNGFTATMSAPYGQGAHQDGGTGGNQYAFGIPGTDGYGSQFFPRTNRINVVDLDSAQRAARTLAGELGSTPASWGQPPGTLSESDLDKQFQAHKTNLVQGLGDLLGQARLGAGGLNRNQLDARAKELAMELRSVATVARTLAAMNDDKIPLLDGAKAVADSVADLMKLLMGSADAPDGIGFPEALSAVEKQIQSAQMLLDRAELIPHTDQGAKLLMLEVIHDVSNNMENLLQTVGKAAARTPPPHGADLLGAVNSFQMVKEPVINNLSNMAPYSLDPKIRQSIAVTHATIDNLGKELVRKAQAAPIPADTVPELKEAADRLAESLAILLNSLDAAEKNTIPPEVDIHSPALTLLETLDLLKANIDDPKKILEYVRAIAGSNNDIVEGATMLQGYVDDDTRNRLTKAAGGVTDALKDLMEATKQYNRKPNDVESKEKVIAAATALEEAAHLLLDDIGVITALNNLRFQTKSTAAALVKLSSTANKLKTEVADPELQLELKNAINKVNHQIPELLQASQVAASRPDDLSAQSELIRVAKTQVPHYSDLASISKKAARLIPDKLKQQDLDYASNDASKNLKMLMKAVSDVSDLSGQTEVENALAEFDVVQADLDSALFFAEQGVLKPVPGQTRENAIPLLLNATNVLAKTINDLQKAAKGGAIPPELIKQAADAGGQIATASKPIAASLVGDPVGQKKILGLAKNVVDQAVATIGLSRALAADNKAQPKIQAVDKGVRQFQATLGDLQQAARAIDAAEVDKALGDIKESIARLSPVAPPGSDFGGLSDQLSGAGKALAASVSNLVSVAKHSPELLGYSAKVVGTSASEVIKMAGATAGSASDRAMQQQLLNAARSLADALSRLLPSAQEAAFTKNPAAVDKMTKNADQVNDTLGDLLSKIGKTGEAESAAARLMSVLQAVDDGSLEVIPGSRQDILNELLNSGKDMARVQSSLVSAARTGDDKLGVFAREAANSATKMVMAAQAAAISDGTGDFAHIDAARIAKGAEFIIANPKDVQKVNAVAKQVTRACGNLLNIAKARAHEEPDAAKRQAIVKSAQKIVSDATDLAQAARGAARKDEPAANTLVKVAKTLKNDTKALEDALKSGRDAKDPNTIDRATAKKLVAETRALASATANLIQSSVQLSGNPQSKKVQEDLSQKADSTSAALQNVLKVAGTLNPVVQNVDRAIDVLAKVSADLDSATVAAQTGGRIDVPVTNKSVKDIQADTLGDCKQVAFDMKELLVAASTNRSADELVPVLEKFEKTPPKLAINALSLAGSMNNDAAKAQLLTMAKLLTDNLSNFLKAVKSSSMGESSARADMSRHSDSAAKALGLLLQQIQSGAQLTQGLEKTADDVHGALTELKKPGEAGPYHEAREALVATTREAANLVTALVGSDKKNPGEVGIIATRIGELMPKLVANTRRAAASTTDQAAGVEIVKSTAEVGKAVAGLIINAKELTEGADKFKEFLEGYNSTNVAISKVLSAAKKGSTSEQQMEKSLRVAKDALRKINDSDLLARAGQLQQSEDKTPISTLQGQLGKGAKRLIKASAAVKEASKLSEEDLAAAVEEIGKSLKDVTDLVVVTASRIPDSIAQRDILVAAHDVVTMANDFITATQTARLSHAPGHSDEAVKAHRALVQNVGKLVAVVQSSSSEASHGERELEMIRQQILSLLEDIPGQPGASIDDVVKAAREILEGTQDFVFAQEPDEVTNAAKEGIFPASQKFLNAAKGVSETTSDGTVQQEVIAAAMNTGQAISELLEVGKRDRQDEATFPLLEEASSNVSTALTGFVAAIRKLPHGEHVKIDELAGDFDAFAEEELLKCSQVIAGASEKLRSFKSGPREKKNAGVLDQEDINEAIVNAALAIAQATGTLVQTSTAAQQERAKMKHQPGLKYHVSPMVAQGLGTAAQGVSSSVQGLVKSASSAVEGNLQEQELEAAARSMASSTAQLVAASRSKSDPNSDTQRKLKVAGKAVTDATSSLVSAAAAAAEFNKQAEEEELQFTEVVNSAAGKVQELELQMKILKLEKQLEQEKRKMAVIKKAIFNKKQ